mmetsp:Transcript_78842/g.159998  ORF Transcript_78842/g.159998 Transcript_78842/m.159998 type:complete len:208 (-) Transcript_78842:85-708(-)
MMLRSVASSIRQGAQQAPSLDNHCLEEARHRVRARFLQRWSSSQDNMPSFSASPAHLSGLQSVQEHTEAHHPKDVYLDKARERLGSRFLARWPSARAAQQDPAAVMQLAGRTTTLEGIALEKNSCLEEARQRLRHRFLARWPSARAQSAALRSTSRIGLKQCVDECSDTAQANIWMSDSMQFPADHAWPLTGKMAASMNVRNFSVSP